MCPHVDNELDRILNMLECSARCAGYCKMVWNLETILVLRISLVFEERAYLCTVGVSDHCQLSIAFKTFCDHKVLPCACIFVDMRCLDLVTLGRVPVHEQYRMGLRSGIRYVTAVFNVVYWITINSKTPLTLIARLVFSSSLMLEIF